VLELLPSNIAEQAGSTRITSSSVSIRIKCMAICRINTPIVLKRPKALQTLRSIPIIHSLRSGRRRQRSHPSDNQTNNYNPLGEKE